MSHESTAALVEKHSKRTPAQLVASSIAACLVLAAGGGCAGTGPALTSSSGAQGAPSAEGATSKALEEARVTIGAVEVQSAGVGALSSAELLRDRAFLTNVEWRWARLIDPMAGPLEVENQRQYVIVLLEDGRAVVKADCNTEVGRATFAEDGSMSVNLPKGSLEPCGAYSMSTEFVNHLESAQRYYLEHDQLVIEVGPDAGLMEFTRGPVAEREARR